MCLMRLLLKGAVLLYIAVTTNVAAAVSNAADFDKPLLRFRFTVHNPGTSAKHLVKVGIHSKVVGGSWNCASAASVMVPDADYLISFHVRTPETEIKADPILKLSPGETSSFTISIIPSATGACGSWQAVIQAFARFDDSTTLESKAENVSSGDLKVYERRIPGREELNHALQHRSASVRASAVQKLNSFAIDDASLSIILGAKLKDESTPVRIEAIYVIASRGVRSENSELANMIRNSEDYDEIKALMYAAKELKDPHSSDVICAYKKDRI